MIAIIWLQPPHHTYDQKCFAVSHPCSNHAAQQNGGEESDSEKERRIGLNFGRSSAIAICCQHATRSMSSQKAFSPPPNPSVWLPCDFGTRNSSRLLWEYIRSRKHGSTNSVPSVWTHVYIMFINARQGFWSYFKLLQVFDEGDHRRHRIRQAFAMLWI